ncbi:MAG: zf-HC2 domain-containing protein [Deltaproteobacteria bacterium]|nr:zf-HC2 domain-containing protein [Deltaproteobacteria bacterium]
MSDGHLSQLKLDTYLLGGLPADERASLEAHLGSCATCSATLADLKARQAQFASTRLPLLMPGAVERASGWRRFFTSRTPLYAALALAIPILLLVLLRPPAPDNGIKGGPALQVVVKHGARVSPLRPGEMLAAGDELRFVIEPGKRRFLLIMSVDGAGTVSVYEPFDGNESAPISGPRVEIPGSVVLDRAPGPERLYALFSDAPISTESVQPALTAVAQGGPPAIRAGGILGVPGASEVSTWFEKEPSP